MTILLTEQKRKIAYAFGRAASDYDATAEFQQQIGLKMVQRLIESSNLKAGDLRNKKLLDAGCGTGFFSQIFGQYGAKVTALDLSDKMLAVAQAKNSATDYLCADMESIPLADQSYDFTFSNLAIQWCDHLDLALNELYRVTKKGGIVAFSTLAAGSLNQLSQTWQHLDNASHVNRFLPLSAIEQSCLPWRHQLQIETMTPTYPSLRALLHSLKGIGATHVIEGRQAGLMTRQRLSQLEKAYPLIEGTFPLTYQIVFGMLYRE